MITRFFLEEKQISLIGEIKRVFGLATPEDELHHVRPPIGYQRIYKNSISFVITELKKIAIHSTGSGFL